jgi:hypothetical protein
MATMSKSWATADDLYKTDAYGGTDADVDGAERFSSDADLETNGYEGSHLHLRYDCSGTTDDLEVAVYASLDGTNYDDIPLFEFTTDNNSGAETELSFVVKDVAHFRVGMKCSGSTDTYDAKLTHQAWRYQSA